MVMRCLSLFLLLSIQFPLASQSAQIKWDDPDPAEQVSMATPANKSIAIAVKDIKTKKSIPFFTVDFTSCGHPVYESNGDGVFSMEAQEGFACYIRIAKSGYSNLDLMVDYVDLPGDGKTYTVFLSRSPNSFSGHVRDTVDGNLYLADAQVELKALSSDYVQQVETSAQGEFSLYLTPDTEYELQVSHPQYLPYVEKFKTGSNLDGHEIKRLYVQKRERDIVRAGLGTEVVVGKKNRSIDKIHYYSVQVLAKEKAAVNLEDYRALKRYGEVFEVHDGFSSKIRVGKYFDRGVAEEALKMIRQLDPYKDAFLTQYLPPKSNPDKSAVSEEKGYMVRLASYLNAEMFDGSVIDELGEITSVRKDEWTIMLLHGFKTIDDAKRAAEKVRKLGFQAAYAVHYDGESMLKL